MSLLTQAISTIEELEIENYKIVSESISEVDYKILHSDLEKTTEELDKYQHLITVLQAERNMLSQVVRIHASNGQVDPVRELDELDMLKGMYE